MKILVCFFFFYNYNMKRIFSYISLTSMVTNNFCSENCDNFKFNLKEQEEKDKKEIFDKTVELFKNANFSKFYYLPGCGNNDDFFLSIDKDKVKYFDFFSDINSRYRNLSNFVDYFGTDYSANMIHNVYDYKESEKYITEIKTKKIKYDDKDVARYILKSRLEDLKKEVFSNKDYGFYILKDGYFKYIEKNFPEFTIKYDGDFNISVNKEYCENNTKCRDLYTFKVYLDKDKLKNPDYLLIDGLTKEKIENVEIKYNYYKLQSLHELTHFADVELNNELKLNHRRCIKLCKKNGSILKEKKELKKGTYYIKLDLFYSKKVKEFLKNEEKNFEKLTEKLDNIVRNKSDYKNKIKNLYEEWKNYKHNFFEKYDNIDTLKENDEDYSNLEYKILDFRHRIIGTLTILQFLDEINSDLGNIKINRELMDENLFKYKDEANRIKRIAPLCKDNKLFYEASSNPNFKDGAIKKINEVYKSYADEKGGLEHYCNNFVFSYVSKELLKDYDNKVDELSKKYEEYLKSLVVNTEYELDASKMECDGFSKDDYINAFKQRCNDYKNYTKGKNIFDKIFDFMKYIAINDDPKYYFYNYFIDDKQIFDYFDPENIVKKDIKIKIIPTKYHGYKINKNQALVYLQREKFEKEKSEIIENAKSKDDLIGSFKSKEDIIDSWVFKEWSELYEKFRYNKNNKYNIDTSYISYELSTSKFPSLGKKFAEKYNGFLEAELDKEIKEGLNELKKVYQSVVDKYEAKINAVKDIDELNNLKGIDEHDLKNEIDNSLYNIEDKKLSEHLQDIIGKIYIKNKEIYENTKMKYVNDILEIYKNKENEFKKAVLQEISSIYNSAAQEMVNKINNSTDIDSLKKLRYEDKSVISTELTNKINSKDNNLENKKEKYAIPININTYVDDIYNEYKKKESLLKSGHKNEDNREDSKEKGQDSVGTNTTNGGSDIEETEKKGYKCCKKKNNKKKE